MYLYLYGVKQDIPTGTASRRFTGRNVVRPDELESEDSRPTARSMSWLAQASATIAGAGQATEAAEAAARAKIGTLPNRSGVPREQGAMQAHLMRCINDELSQHAKQKGISASHQKLYVTMESTVKKVVGRKKSNDHDVYPPPGSCRPPPGPLHPPPGPLHPPPGPLHPPPGLTSDLTDLHPLNAPPSSSLLLRCCQIHV